MLRWLICITVFCAGSVGARAQSLCPAAEYLPQLTIDDIRDPAVPVIDDWQVFFGPVPLSDAQLAQLAGDDPLIDRTRAEMKARGSWVYIGMGMSALGTALSSAGWVLYGQNELSQGLTLPLALGGIALGVAGLLVVSDSLQRPIEPHVAPTPMHRLTRNEARELVRRINHQMYREICAATQVAR